MKSKFFDSNGNEIEVEGIKPQRFSPNSCDCEIIYDAGDNNKPLLEGRKCKLHKNLSGQARIDSVFNHNQSFEKSHPNYIAGLTKQDIDAINELRDIEKKRIKTL